MPDSTRVTPHSTSCSRTPDDDTMSRDEDLTAYDAEIPDRDTFARFLMQLADDLRTNPDDWERTDLATFLEVAAFYTSHDAHLVHQNLRKTPAPEPPTWRFIADILTHSRTAYPDWDE